MGRHAMAAFVVCSLLAGSDARAEGPGPALTGPQLGAPAPAFLLRTLEGKTVALEQFRGKTLVLNVWATWCPPCRQEMPELIKGYESYSKQGVAFLGVDTTEEAPIVRAYLAARDVPYAQALDSDKRFSEKYDVQAFPTTYVIDPQGILRARYIDVLASAQLGELIAAASAGRNVEIGSPLQLKIDATLEDGTISFEGNPATIVANVKSADAAIARAESLLDESDAAKGNPTNFLRTRTEEAALRDRAIEALAGVAAGDEERVLLARLRGDAALEREQWSAALDGYGAALALDPKNRQVLQGSALAAERLGQPDAEIRADARLVTLQPESVDALVELGLAYGRAKRFDAAAKAFGDAVRLAERHLRAKPGDAAAIRKLAWVHLYAGRTYAKAGDDAKAHGEFEQSLASAQRLPTNDERHDMYIEEDQEAIVALGLGAPLSGASVSLAPWTGAELPGSIPNTLKYRLVVAGVVGKSVTLQAAGVPRGWIASFCSDRVCAPFKTSVAIPQSGVKIIEFQLVSPAGRVKPAKVRVIVNDGVHTATATT
jgi:peroxiredoxin